MAYKIVLKTPIRSKPRGGLNRYGTMTHALNGYHEYQAKIRFKLTVVYGEKPLPEFWCVCYIFYSPIGKLGRKQDIDNMIGMVNDVLTPSPDKHGNMSYSWLRDDSWSYLPRIWGEVRSSKTSEIHLYFCKNPLDFLQLFVKLYLADLPLQDITSIISKIYAKIKKDK
jgi:hypothetical protein